MGEPNIKHSPSYQLGLVSPEDHSVSQKTSQCFVKSSIRGIDVFLFCREFLRHYITSLIDTDHLITHYLSSTITVGPLLSHLHSLPGEPISLPKIFLPLQILTHQPGDTTVR